MCAECYEAFVIYSFYTLLVVYLGGEIALHTRCEKKEPVKHVFPFCCLPAWTHGEEGNFLLFTQIGTLQYVIIKPLCAVLTFICVNTNTYHDGAFDMQDAYPYLAFVTNFSQIVAMYASLSLSLSLSLFFLLCVLMRVCLCLCLCRYCLIQFYLPLSEDLKPMRPVFKFMVVKAVVFFTWWQGYVCFVCFIFNFILYLLFIYIFYLIIVLCSLGLAILGKYNLLPAFGGAEHEPETVTALQDFIVCIEMSMAAVAHHVWLRLFNLI